MRHVMRVFRFFGSLAAAGVLLGAAGASAVGPQDMKNRPAAPTVFEQARPFAVQALDGEAASLEGELARGPLVLVVLRGWPGYQCPFCTRQFGDFLAHAKEFEAAGARVLWIYPGPSDQVELRAKEFTAHRTLPPNFRVATDPGYVVTNTYGLRWDAPNETAYPATFVVDRASIVRFAQVSMRHDGRAQAVDVLSAIRALSR